MDVLFGSTDLKLLGPGGATTAVSALAGKEVVALYFSAHWCPPCRSFTPKLAAAYKTIAAAKPFEIVFISSDKDETQFAAYHQEMPWLALPFAERDLKKKLSKQFKVSGIPALILLDAKTGQVLSKDGRSVIMGDTAGEQFPWAPKSLDDLLGEVLINGAGAEVNRATTLAGKHLALYFSAHWCPPCKRFTPELAKTYQAMKARRQDFELVFVSGDRNEAAFTSYFKEMPWLALPYDEERYQALSSHFEVEGIPTLVVLSPEGTVITTKGRAAAAADFEGHDFPWPKKPVSSLEEASGELNETPSLIILCEQCSVSEKTAIAEALTAPAQEALIAGAADGAEQHLVFATANEQGSIADQVRKLCKLDASTATVSMVLLDIPDEGAFYVWEPPADGATTAITEDSVRQFTAAYKNKTLVRHQLG